MRLALGVEAGLSIPQAVREMHRLDRAFFDSALARSQETGLYVLPLADEAADMAALPSLQDLSILMQILRTVFDVVVVYWGLFSRQAVQSGNDGGRRQLLLCCNQRFASVRHAKFLLKELLAAGTPIQDIVLTIHQLAPNLTPAPDAIARAVGAERFMTLNTSWACLVQAHNQGRPLCLAGASSYAMTLRSHLAGEGLLPAGSDTRTPNIFSWLRKAAAS